MASHRPSYSGFFSRGKEPQGRQVERVGWDGTSLTVLAEPESSAFVPGPCVGSGREFAPKHPGTRTHGRKPKRSKEKRCPGSLESTWT